MVEEHKAKNYRTTKYYTYTGIKVDILLFLLIVISALFLEQSKAKVVGVWHLKLDLWDLKLDLFLAVFFFQLLGEDRFQDIEKIKTIGSTYMAVSGLSPEKQVKHEKLMISIILF